MMKKKRLFVTALIMSLVLIFSGTYVFADADLVIDQPTGTTFYRGEFIPFEIYGSVPEDIACDTLFWVKLFNSKDKAVWEKCKRPFDEEHEDYIFTGQIPAKKTVKLAAGVYSLTPEIWYLDSETIAHYKKPIKLKTLKPSKTIKAKTGKRKVKLTYSKAGGATKYVIYRSSKKNSGYKKIGATTALKYTDRKAKKGRRYYYRVRTVRSKGFGKVKSKLSKPVRSKTVK